jgi:hypothetical protein
VTEALAARVRAEEKLRAVLDWPEEELALLLHLLGRAGWTQDKARGCLVRRGWWLQ